MTRIALLALIAALGACSQEPPAVPIENEAAVAGAPEASEHSQHCRGVAPPLDSAGFETVGAFGGYSIAASPGMLTCGEPADDQLRCNARGPGQIHLASETEKTGYELLAGETGTLMVGPNGKSCALNVSVN
jgi:hypothetical protein